MEKVKGLLVSFYREARDAEYIHALEKYTLKLHQLNCDEYSNGYQDCINIKSETSASIILHKLKEQFELRKEQHALMCKDREENISAKYACFETLNLIDVLIRTAEEICASERNDG